MTHSGSQRRVEAELAVLVPSLLLPSPPPPPPSGPCHSCSFVPVSWLPVSFISVKNNVTEVGSLAKLLFNSILFLGLSSLLPGNVLIGSFCPLLSLYYSQGSLESPLLFSSLSYMTIDCLVFCSFKSLPSSSGEGEELLNQLGES